jgi:hypothetical protein
VENTERSAEDISATWGFPAGSVVAEEPTRRELPGGGYEVTYRFTLLPDADTSTLENARYLERERCCRDVCWRCGAGEPVESEDGILWTHGPVTCKASPIRARVAAYRGERPLSSDL